MKATKVTMCDFMSHDDTTLEIPERGVILVTGPTGAGKSAIAECFSGVLWGKSLRGGKGPWRNTGTSEGRIDFADGSWVARKKTKSRFVVSGEDANGKPLDADTATKIQPTLNERYGEFAVWSRAAVFSSDSAASFARATDSERKRLLESLLGLERFDTALVQCRADLSAAVSRLDALRGELRVVETKTTSLKARLRDLKADKEGTIKPSKPELEPAPVPQKIEIIDEVVPSDELFKTHALEIRQKISGLEAEQNERRSDYQKVSEELAVTNNMLSERQKHVRKFADGKCPTCGQGVTGDHAHIMTEVEELKADREDKQAKLQALQAEGKETKAQIAEAQKELSSAEGEISRIEKLRVHVEKQESLQAVADEHHANAKRQWEARRVKAEQRYKSDCALYEKRLTSFDARIKDVRAEVFEAVDRCEELLDTELPEADKEIAILKGCEHALGLKGVRAHLLSQAIKSLEMFAQVWIAKLVGEGITVSIRPYREKASGGTLNAIDINIEGIADGQGYMDASNGQRRLLDIAFLLSLADLARAANPEPGMLFFDEVFDALDAECRSSVSSVLHELAQDRPVFVITHHPEFAETMSPTLSLRVEDGKIWT